LADRTHNGQPLRLLTVIDELTREFLAIRVARRLTAQDAQECLTELFCSRGIAEHIRSDSGPECTSLRSPRWSGESDARALFIEPESP
jgi:hypothetical protein